MIQTIAMRKRFLIIKVGAIGDAVMALPTLKKIREDYPTAHITWLGGKIIQSLIESTSLVDAYLSINEKQLYTSSLLSKLKVIVKVWLLLFFKKFDAIYILHSDNRYRLFTWSCFAKTKKLATSPHYIKLDQYHAIGYLKVYQNITYPITQMIDYPKINFSEKKWEHHHLNTIIPQKSIVLAPGGTKNTLREQAVRRWPIHYYLQLAKQLIHQGWNIVIIGSAADNWILSYFQQLPVINLVGKNNLLETCFSIHLAQAFITHDCGPMHLAKLTNTPTLALFGPVSPFARYSINTYQNNISMLWGGEELACRPCYDGKEFACCKNNLCMSQITPEIVLNKIYSILTTTAQADSHLTYRTNFLMPNEAPS